MQYAILIYGDESNWQTMTEQEGNEVMGAYFAYTTWLQEQNLMREGAPLQPSPTAKTIRERDGERLVSDGPFAETREQLGGYYVIETDDEALALEAAARCPGARRGAVELRPVMVMDTAPA